MIDIITKLIYEYTKKEKIVDNEYIKKIINIYYNNNDIKGFLKEISFKNTNNEFMATYDPKEKNISIDTKNIIKKALDILNQEKIPDNDYERLLKINLYITKVLIHELNHAKQYKTIYSDDDSLAKELYKLSLGSNLIVLDNNYTLDTIPENILMYLELSSKNYLDNDFYISMPAERMAEINALKLCKEIATNIDSKDNEKVAAYESIKYILGQQIAYNNYAPTPYFTYRDNLIRKESGLEYGSTNITKISSYFEKIARENSYSLDEKLYYGLPISTEEKRIKEENIQKYERILFR